MKEKTIRQTIMISEKQKESLDILKKYDVNVSHFIRQAIKDKLSKDWKKIKERKERIKIPF